MANNNRIGIGIGIRVVYDLSSAILSVLSILKACSRLTIDSTRKLNQCRPKLK